MVAQTGRASDGLCQELPNPVKNPSIALKFVDVICLLGSFPALSGLTISIERGELVAIEGPNGAGKTTFLRACAGLQPIASGEATVCDINVRRDPRRVRPKVGYLGHRTLLYDDLTVEDNVSFSVRANSGPLHRKSRADSEAVRGALTAVGIDQRVAGLALHSCSAGQRRRTALAALIARNPEVWLLDEPHASLDAEGKESLDALLKDAVTGGATVLVVSHDPDRIRTFASRAITVAGGHVVNDIRMSRITTEHAV